MSTPTHPSSGASLSPLAQLISQLGPGAIMASLTIGSGELIFSSRGGALFGFKVLGIFAAVLLLKWALVMGSAHHWLASGTHPLERWARLPGPTGWLPLTFLLLALTAFPIWVSFHAGTIGTLLGALTGSSAAARGTAPLIWGLAALLFCLALSATGSYARSEKIQSTIIAVMLLAVLVSLVLLKPDVQEMLRGLFYFGPLHYPAWASATPEFNTRPVWVELANYAGVLGGGGYDYLAYVAWLREKHQTSWQEGLTNPAARTQLRRIVWADATFSFLMVLVFTSVFVTCGALLLGPQQRVPAGNDLLTLQAQFVAGGIPWLRPLYFLGALLAMGGTLYGTIEVAPTILREILRAVPVSRWAPSEGRVRTFAIRWCAGVGLLLISTNILRGWSRPGTPTLNLVTWLTPANLFTGVMACGIICWLTLWADRRFLSKSDRMPWGLTLLNAMAGALFLGLGLKGYWELSQLRGITLLGLTLAIGWGLARWNHKRVPAE